MRIRRILLGIVVLLATVSFVAGATVKTGDTAGGGADTNLETGAIFTGNAVVSVAELGVSKKAREDYERGVRALRLGRASNAERDVKRALREDTKFSDAYALEATAELSQRDFVSAQIAARSAIDADASNWKAYVILATSDNYLSEYADAVAALEPVQAASAQWWQIAYQRARAEAGLEHAHEALEWSNRAALQAPADFAPLHLLHASALVASAQYSQAAEELETYLELEGTNAPQRDELQRELGRLRELAGQKAGN